MKKRIVVLMITSLAFVSLTGCSLARYLEKSENAKNEISEEIKEQLKEELKDELREEIKEELAKETEESTENRTENSENGSVENETPPEVQTPVFVDRPNANEGTGTIKDLEVGDVAPDFTVTLTNGERFVLSDHDNEVVLINFWATWCGPCVSEMPEFQDLYEENIDGFSLVAINSGERKSEVDSFVDDNGFTFNIAYDQNYTVGDYYPTMYIPYTVIVNRGIVSQIFVGSQSYDDFKEAINNCL